MRPIIGVTPDFNVGDREDMGGQEPMYFLRARYLSPIEQAGGIPLILPLLTEREKLRSLLTTLDGLVLSGSGSDLAPELYGERQRYKFRRMSRQRSALELQITKLAYHTRIPTLGICGGMQSLNVALGGTMIQDIASQFRTTILHQPSFSATKPAHPISTTPKSLLRRITRRATIQVNSSHHQSIKRVASSLVQTATSPDGVIEAVEAPSHDFFLGVQWHPEFMYEHDPVQRRLFSALVNAAKRYAQGRNP